MLKPKFMSIPLFATFFEIIRDLFWNLPFKTSLELGPEPFRNPAQNLPQKHAFFRPKPGAQTSTQTPKNSGWTSWVMKLLPPFTHKSFYCGTSHTFIQGLQITFELGPCAMINFTCQIRFVPHSLCLQLQREAELSSKVLQSNGAMQWGITSGSELWATDSAAPLASK